MTEIADFDHGRADGVRRATLPSGEYSGLDPAEFLAGKHIPEVRLPLGNGPDLTDEIVRRDHDLDPQLVWRGKETANLNDLCVKAPPLFVQERIHPRMLIEDMRRRSARRRGLADPQGALVGWDEALEQTDSIDFYRHEEAWSNRMILGDSLNVMASLLENEGYCGRVQMVYIDPPYGIRFNSNWQPSTKSTNVKDGADLTREPEMIKAFRDTWKGGVHSYLAYLRDRLVLARDFLTNSGSCFVQICDAHVHRVRCLMDEVFGQDNFVSLISYKKGGTSTASLLSNITDFILWYAKERTQVKYRKLTERKEVGVGASTGERYDHIELLSGARRSMSKNEKIAPNRLPSDVRIYKESNPCSQHDNPRHREHPFVFQGKSYFPPRDRQWSVPLERMPTLAKANRLISTGKNLAYVMYIDDSPSVPINNIWENCLLRSSRIYVVQTAQTAIQRCMLMSTDPGDLVLDPTCGSGTTAVVAEQWGRRWVTIDASRVALALARRRVMTAKFPYYLLADSEEGVAQERKITGKAIMRTTQGRIAQGFVYERVPHITLKAIANNTEIDVIHGRYAETSRELREALGRALGQATPEEWEVPFEASPAWGAEARELWGEFRKLWQSRQKEIDASIARNAETEYLYDRPYEDKRKARVAGPFTVESMSPVQALVAVERPDGTTDAMRVAEHTGGEGEHFVARMLKLLRGAGVRQMHKADRLTFAQVEPWAGQAIQAEAWTQEAEGTRQKHVAIAIGPEFGTVTRNNLLSFAREVKEAGCFDVAVVCAFGFEAHATEEVGAVAGCRVLLARMNADLHMELDDKGANANAFVIYGEPDVDILREGGDFRVRLNGVDVYVPKLNTVRSGEIDDIDCWMVDTAYNEQCFVARQVFFPDNPQLYKSFRAMLNNDIDEEEWAAAAGTLSHPFPRPDSNKIAVKVINHFGDEVMKVFDLTNR